MNQTELIPHLFRTEYRKIIAVLCRLFGIEHVAVAEDIASDTFLLASELWSIKGIPENPTAWLYTVAKNRTKDHLKRNILFAKTISRQIKYDATATEELDIDLSIRNINDSQLAMIFVVCHPCNPPDAQIGLALNLLCGFGADEIANAFLTNKEVIYKRLQRAKEKLRIEKIDVAQPSVSEMNDRLFPVLTTLYLLFNEGYYSSSQDITLRKELCFEATRLANLLIENQQTNTPAVSALISLMCFHSSRFDARIDDNLEVILYGDQDAGLWDKEFIAKGEYFLNESANGTTVSRYHLEAGIAYWHTIQADSTEKWESILQLYNQLLLMAYSPVAALNRTYALARVYGKKEAIFEAEKIALTENHLYHALLGELYTDVDHAKAIFHLQTALTLAKSTSDKKFISKKLAQCQQKEP